MKNSYSVAIVCALASAATHAAQAQTNYKPGYIVTQAGDTLRGQIDFQDWRRNPASVTFRTGESAAAASYQPAQIRGFGAANQHFASAYVQVETSPRSLANLSSSPDFALRQDTLFVRPLIDGPKSLYSYVDADDNEHFYFRNGAALELLLYKKFIRYAGSAKTVVPIENYKGQLAAYLGEFPGAQASLAAADYTRSRLEKLYAGYYKQLGAQPAFRQKTQGTSAEFGVLAGGTVSRLTFSSSSEAYYHLTKTPLEASKGFSGGLFLNLTPPSKMRRLSFVNELMFSAYEFKGHYRDTRNANTYTDTDFVYAAGYLKLNNLLRYSYGLGSTRVFLNAGISNGLMVSQKNTRTDVSHFYTTVRTTQSKALDDVRPYEQSLVFGLGGRLSRFSAEARHEIGNGMSYIVALRSTTSRTHILTSFYLK
ncbi:PorT family protein [Hymenobacter latericus]|uniref:PorT family protein n=1 Tax=Hymenobacter sp. YIM 151858-1 TaxID=2987688 RepID=UPI0022277007|nr:PorT family protein [Hymenobacter sp. YIM 151858-1]UYZ57957.1 PorT family protein [Hymenobacter sp. YIM 151858-1]